MLQSVFPVGLRYALSASFALAVLLLSSCASPRGTSVETAPRPDETAERVRLTGTEWVLVSLRGRAPVDGTPITIEFDVESADGYAGCNRYGARFEGAAESFKSVPLDMTQVGCAPEELARQEEDYVQALGESLGYEVRGDHLEVLGKGGEILLVYERKRE